MPAQTSEQSSEYAQRRSHRLPHRWSALRARSSRRYVTVAPVLLAIAVGALLAGCGGVGATDTGGTATPNTSAPTRTAGPLVIATDHSIYSPTEAIHVTVTNQLSEAIYAFDTQASCSVLSLQISQNGQWVHANTARCPLGRVARPVQIAPGASYTATITAGYAGIPSSAGSYFTPGQYRLVLSYYTKSPASGASQPTLTYSATLTVVGPIPSPAPQGTAHPAGTVSSGTIVPAGTTTAK